MTTKRQVLFAHQCHPDWRASQIAELLKCRPEYVRAIVSRNHIKLPDGRLQVKTKEDAA